MDGIGMNKLIMSDLSIIVISYNCLDLVTNILLSLKDIKTDIILIDNASTDGTPDKIEKEFLNVRVIRNQSNEGYAKAINIGVHYSLGSWIIVSNADVEFHNGCIENMIDYLQKNQDVGIVGAQQLFPDGSWQRSYGNAPGLFGSLKDLLGITSLRQFIRKKAWSGWVVDNKQREVGYIDGAVMAIRRESYESIGGFDEEFFFYSEDADFCFRLRKAGWGVVFLPSARVTHLRGGSSTKVSKVNDKFIQIQVDSKVLLFKKHYPEWKVRLLILMEYLHAKKMFFIYNILSLLSARKQKRDYFSKRLQIFLTSMKTWQKYLKKC